MSTALLAHARDENRKRTPGTKLSGVQDIYDLHER